MAQSDRLTFGFMFNLYFFFFLLNTIIPQDRWFLLLCLRMVLFFITCLTITFSTSFFSVKVCHCFTLIKLSINNFIVCQIALIALTQN